MKDILVSQLRNKNTTIEDFRKAADKLAEILAIESCQFLEKHNKQITTPICQTVGTFIDSKVFLIPILRAGLVFLPAFLKYYPDSKVGFLGIKRDEATALPQRYYEKLSNLELQDSIFILDPMIATGGSALLAIEMLKNKGIKEERIKVIAMIASKEGALHLKTIYPLVELLIATIDDGLNDHKFITPGLGDFGDRYFGTT
jgi:uracil phosphoribosyltransferase